MDILIDLCLIGPLNNLKKELIIYINIISKYKRKINPNNFTLNIDRSFLIIIKILLKIHY